MTCNCIWQINYRRNQCHMKLCFGINAFASWLHRHLLLVFVYPFHPHLHWHQKSAYSCHPCVGKGSLLCLILLPISKTKALADETWLWLFLCIEEKTICMFTSVCTVFNYLQAKLTEKNTRRFLLPLPWLYWLGCQSCGISLRVDHRRDEKSNICTLSGSNAVYPMLTNCEKFVLLSLCRFDRLLAPPLH